MTSTATALVCFVILIGLISLNAYLTRRQRRIDKEQLALLQRIIQASEPRPWSAPAAKGFEKKRKVS